MRLNGDALQKLGNEAVESTNDLMQAYASVGRFMSFHAQSIKARIDAGAKVDDEFVDELLGTSSQLRPVTGLSLTRLSSSSTMDYDDDFEENGRYRVDGQ